MLHEGYVIQNRYQIIREIGIGGTGIIYLAFHLHLQKYVVVKKLKDHMANRVDIRAEVDVMKRLHHSYLPQVYDFIEMDGEVYTVIEFIDGHDLQYYLDCGSTFAEMDLRRWLEQLCEVLDYLHGLDPPILHCDIKPANIMITPEGNVCLIDFNISLNYEGTIDLKGLSVWYSAPEQYQAACMGGSQADLDGRMDLYSLGATFYRIITGQLPTVDREAFCPITYFDTPYSDGLIRILAKAMEWNRSKRYHSAAQMLAALKNIKKQDRMWKRWKLRQAALVGGCGFLFVLGMISAWYGIRANEREGFLESYQMFCQYDRNQQYEAVIQTGTEILNKKAYQPFLTEERKGEILKQIGEGYFYQEDYESGEQYYQDALQYLPEDVSCIRDYAITLARQGKDAEAKELLIRSRISGITDGTLLLVYAEICFQQEDSEGALEYLSRLETEGADSETLSAAYCLKADIYEGKKDYEAQVQALRKAEEYAESNRIRRELAAALVALAGEREGTEKTECLSEAIDLYEALASVQGADYIDVVNLALALRGAGRGQEGIIWLEHLIEKGDDHYQVYGCLAVLEYDAEQEKPAAGRDYMKAYDHAEKAMDGYREEGASNMDQLREQVERIALEGSGREQ